MGSTSQVAAAVARGFTWDKTCVDKSAGLQWWPQERNRVRVPPPAIALPQAYQTDTAPMEA